MKRGIKDFDGHYVGNVFSAWGRGNDGKRFGTNPKGDKHGMSKLSEKKVRVMKHITKIPNHIPLKQIAEIFNITYRTLRYALSGHTWKNITN